MVCANLGDQKNVTVNWSTKNATQVLLSNGGPLQVGVPNSGSSSAIGHCKGGGFTYTLTAKGPGGTTTTSASANYTIPTK